MKVFIGPYTKTSKKKRKIRVKIHGYDTWSADHTLAHIIYPVLKQMKKQKQGAPCVDDEDVPEHLRSTQPDAREKCTHEYDTDKYWFKRWDYVLKEMTWTFKQIRKGERGENKFYDHSKVDHTKGIMEQVSALQCDYEGLKNHNERIANGTRLFGKYYQALWT